MNNINSKPTKCYNSTRAGLFINKTIKCSNSLTASAFYLLWSHAATGNWKGCKVAHRNNFSLRVSLPTFAVFQEQCDIDQSRYRFAITLPNVKWMQKAWRSKGQWTLISTWREAIQMVYSGMSLSFHQFNSRKWVITRCPATCNVQGIQKSAICQPCS